MRRIFAANNLTIKCIEIIPANFMDLGLGLGFWFCCYSSRLIGGGCHPEWSDLMLSSILIVITNMNIK